MTDVRYPSTQTPKERLELWTEIEKAGGIEPYVHAFLRQAGVVSPRKPSSPSQKSDYKKAKRLETEVTREIRKRVWLAWKETHIVHLGDGVFFNDLIDADRFDLERREERLTLNQLPPLKNITELAKFFEISVPLLRSLTYHRDVDTHSNYSRFTIPKADGSDRLISAPKTRLKTIQRTIYDKLLAHLPVHGAAHGFLPGRSIASHAALHSGASIVVKVDIKDFFPTLTLPRIKGFFRKIGYQEQVAVLLALLCTEAPREIVEHEGKSLHVALGPRSLPQGAPTSPPLTNLICLSLDRRLSALAHKLGWTYSRYADDMAFSWHQVGQAESPIQTLLHFVHKIVSLEGFKIHPKKTRIMRPSCRQILTGLVLNPSKEALAFAKAAAKAAASAPVPPPPVEEKPKPKRKSKAADAEAAASPASVEKAAASSSAPPPAAPVLVGPSTAPRVPREIRRQIRAAIHNRSLGKPGKPDETIEQLRGLAAFVHQTDPALGRVFLDQIKALPTAEDSASSP